MSRHTPFHAPAFPIVLALLAGCWGPDPAPPEGRFVYTMRVPMSLAEEPTNRTLLGSSALPEATDFLNEQVHLVRDVPVEYILCERANAYWEPHNETIQICHQLGAFLYPQIRASLAVSTEGEYADPAAFEADAVGIALNAVRFIYYHEVAHALIQLYELPVTGREEDVADQFATWLLLRDHRPAAGHLAYNVTAGEGVALSGAIGFVAFARANALSSLTTIHWAQAHSFDLQRAYNIVCWVYGGDPVRLAWLTPKPTQAERLYVPPEREPWCAYEHDRIDYAFSTLLQDHLR